MQFEHPATTDVTQPDKPSFSEVIINKIWRKGRFCTLSYWPEGKKCIVDIGEFDPNSGKLTSSSKCYVDVVDMYAYLWAEVNNAVLDYYPDFDSQENSKSGFVSYGGKGDVARVFKSHWWAVPKKGSDEFFIDKTARVFKCGHFKGQTNSSGAIMPVWNAPISMNSVKVTRLDLLNMYLSLSAYVSAHPYAGS